MHFHVTALFQTLYYALFLQGLFTHRECRIYVFYGKANAINLTVRDSYLHQDSDTSLEGLPCFLFEVTLKGKVLPAPNHGAGLGDEFSSAALAQLQVTVTVGPGAPGTYLCLYPHRHGVTLRHRVLDGTEQSYQVYIYVVLSHSCKYSTLFLIKRERFSFFAEPFRKLHNRLL